MTEGTTVEVTVAPEVATQKADEPASSVPENLVAPDPTANVVETPADTEKPQDTAVVEEPQDGAKSVEEDVPIKLPDSASKEVDESVQGVSGVVIQSVTSEVDTTLQPESVAEEIPSILPKQAEGVKVFVGILPRTVADEELRKVFESAGPLVALYVGLDKRNITCMCSTDSLNVSTVSCLGFYWFCDFWSPFFVLVLLLFWDEELQ